MHADGFDGFRDVSGNRKHSVKIAIISYMFSIRMWAEAVTYVSHAVLHAISVMKTQNLSCIGSFLQL